MRKLALTLINKCLETKDPYLDIGNCSLTDEDFTEGSPIDRALRGCTHLKTLILSNGWNEYVNLKDLEWPYVNPFYILSQNAGKENILTSIPSALGFMEDILKLICCGTYQNKWGIRDISVVTKLSKLIYLDISYNQIDKLKGLENLTSLQTFSIFSNQISDLTGLENLKTLQNFQAGYNRITNIKELCKLTDLQDLLINDNQITDLRGFENLITLHRLNLSYNQINDISPLLPLLRQLENPLQIVMKDDLFNLDEGDINVNGNPLTTPPVEIIQQGKEAILNWFKARDQGSIINHEAKCILFGNALTGKTTLSHQLRKNEFLEEYISTHGILIKEWIIPEKDFPTNLRKGIQDSIDKHKIDYPEQPSLEFPKSLQLNVWDFGGQEYYHATHRLFMNSNVLYLLLWDEKSNRQNDEDKKNPEYPIEYWQSNINHFSPKNITLNVQNKVTGKSQITDREFLFKIEMRDKQNEKSIKRYDLDIDDLKTGIFNQLANLSYIGKPFPKVYEDIRQALRNETRYYMTFEDYKNLCRQTDQTPDKIMKDDSHIKTVTQFLHDTGAIVCYTFKEDIRSENLKNYVFTRPHWLTDVIYSILEKEKKEFNKTHVENIASRYGLETDVWVELMKEFELIFEIKRNEKIHYVVPQYLNNEYNVEAFDLLKEATNWKYVFTFYYPQFLPKSNFLRFIAKYGSQSTKFLYWKEGLVFTKDKKTVYAECKQKKISISIQDRDENLTKELFESLLKIDEADKLQVSVNEEDYVEVKKLKEKTNKKISGIESTIGKTLGVEEFGVLFGINNKNNILKITERNMNNIKIFLASSSELKADREQFEIFIGRKNNDWVKKDVHLELIVWEDFLDAMSQTGLQSEYNKQIKNCDIFIMLFFTKVGKYTEEEFETAFGQFKETNKPFIFTYFKDANISTGEINEEDVLSLINFKKKIKKLGHYITHYKSIEDLKFQFNNQLDKLAESHFMKNVTETKEQAQQPTTIITQTHSGTGDNIGGDKISGDKIGGDKIINK